MATINKKEVGDRIKTIRLSLGLTLNEFGEKISPPASKSNVSRWEKGKNIPNKARLLSIAEIGAVSVDCLLMGDVSNELICRTDLLERENQLLKSKIAEFSNLFDSIQELLDSRKNS